MQSNKVKSYLILLAIINVYLPITVYADSNSAANVNVQGGFNHNRLARQTDTTEQNKHFILSHRDGAVSCSVDNGVTWIKNRGVFTEKSYAREFFKTKGNIFLAGAANGDIYRSSGEPCLSWEKVFTPEPDEVHKIRFYGNIYNDKETLFAIDNHAIYSSNDQGSSWQLLYKETKQNRILRTITGIENQPILWVGGIKDLHSSHQSTLGLYSTDNGQSWQEQSNFSSVNYIEDATAVDENTIIAVGNGRSIDPDDESYRPGIIISTDKGSTWQSAILPSERQLSYLSTLYHVKKVGQNSLIATSYDATQKVFYSDNGGKAWQLRTIPAFNGRWGISITGIVAESPTAWSIFGNYEYYYQKPNYKSVQLVTIDSGKNWQQNIVSTAHDDYSEALYDW